jgi:CBS-domain-containing membrane protein
MNSTIERLLSLRVGDVMTRDVVTVSANETLDEAAVRLNRHDVSGAPVVDEMSQCVGILSASDFLRSRAQNAVATDAAHDGGEHTLAHESDDQPYHIEDVSANLVRQHMTPAVQAIQEEATLIQAARAMCAEHVHRLPVLDEHGRVAGVISSLDVMSAFVKAVEE